MNPNKFISNLMTFFNHFENKNSIEFEKPVNSNLFFFQCIPLATLPSMNTLHRNKID